MGRLLVAPPLYSTSVNNMSVQNDATPLQPVPPGGRVPALDFLRGFALFGVLLAYTLWNLGAPPGDTYGQADRILNWAMATLVELSRYIAAGCWRCS
jgi:uncharacterized membrane protein YeiB